MLEGGQQLPISHLLIEEPIPASHRLRRIRQLADQALDRLNRTF